MAQFNFGDERIIYTIANTNAVVLAGDIAVYREHGNWIAIGHTEDTPEDYQKTLSLNVRPFRQDELETIHKTLTDQEIIKPEEEIYWVSLTKRKTNINKYTPT